MATNNFSSGSIKINGNGNAVGNGNRVTYVNKTTITKYGGSGSGGGRDDGNGKGAAGGEWVLGAGIGGVIALAALSFWFTRYSEIIYKVLTLISMVSGGFGALASAKQVYDSDYMEGLRSFAVTAIAALTFLSVGAASDTMPSDLAAFSKTGTFNTFWCGLSLFGQQMASQHSILGTFVMVPLAVLTMLQSWRSATIAMAEGQELPAWAESTFEAVSGGRQFVAMCVVCVLCVAAHSSAGDEFWKEHFNSRMSFFCPKK